MHLISRVVVAGGLVFFEEYKGTEPHELLIIYMGIALMISAMVTIAFCKLHLCTSLVWPGDV
jgi:glucose uptake protein GlcU